ncbi:universal stress protein [Pseudoflavitalea rhizosphaerae]|uniref:universal stress protein n=1 Tax=Pseudoflavitalea rhizosphaerae TaxID=1884793 RepID=UPI000F8E18CD|nr:universal stress protein [Pseudoflavitalea rhizosphaerae]
MRNVLIPTDYSLASLELVEKTVQCLQHQNLNIILFHAFEIPFHVTDIVGNNGKLPYRDIVTDAFRNGCKRLKEQFPKAIQSILLRHLYGNTSAVFHNFCDANEIDLIVFPDHFVFTPVHPQSVNPAPLFRKAGLPLLKSFTQAKKLQAVPSSTSPEMKAVIENEYNVTETEVYATKKQYSAAVHLREDTQ